MGAGASSALQDSAFAEEGGAILDAWPRIPLAKRTQAHAAAAAALDAAVESSYDVTVTLYGANDLPKTDGSRGISDPYVILQVGDAEQQSEYVKNDLDPNFGEVQFTFANTRASTLQVRVMDKDWSNSDDPLGDATLPFVGLGAPSTPLTLDLSTVRALPPGSITLAWSRAPTSHETIPAPPAIDADASDVVEWVSEALNVLPEAARATVVEKVVEAYASRAVEAETSDGAVELSVTMVSASNLANDKKERSQSDPYCALTLVVDGEAVETVKMEHVWNDLSPAFDETFSFTIDAAKLTTSSLRVEMTDYDSRGGHEALGSVDASLKPRPGAFVFDGSAGPRTMSLVTAAEGFAEAQGSVTLAWSFAGDIVDDALRARAEARAKQEADADETAVAAAQERAAALAKKEEEARALAEAATKAEVKAAKAGAKAKVEAEAAAARAQAEARQAQEAAAAEALRVREEEALAARRKTEEARERVREAERKAREEAAETQRFEALARAKAEAEALEVTRREDAERKSQEAKRKEEQLALAQAATEAREREEAARLAKEAAEKRARAAEERRQKAKEDQRAKEEAARVAAEQARLDAKPVLRREVRSLSRPEKLRFARALRRMMQAPDGPGTSEYARIAGYHGWPGDVKTGETGLCAHRRESFPGWHRAYTVEIETALREADRALGNDGRIGFPYWDCMYAPSLNGEVVPAVIREFFEDLPRDMIDASSSSSEQFEDRGFSRINDDDEVLELLERYDVRQNADNALTTSQHGAAASTASGSNDDLESPHNYVHVACGYPMTTTSFAAYYPAFFLHHCNVDRLYEAYLRAHPDSQSEFSRSNAKEYATPLKPFVNRNTGSVFRHADCFDAARLGYAYDSLPKQPRSRLREPPDYALFRGLDLGLEIFKDQAYLIHVFVVPKSDEAFELPLVRCPRDEHKYYAGSSSIFGGRGDNTCENCRSKTCIDVMVDVTKMLRHTLQLGRKEVVLKTMVVDANTDELIELGDESTQRTGIPQPELVGPWWRDAAELSQGNLSDETRAVQEKLTVSGFYDGKLDGDFGEKTHDALKAFQEINRLKSDGIVGPKTLSQFKKPRYDASKDIGAGESVYASDALVTYTVAENSPGYLPRQGVLDELDDAFAHWSEASGVVFQRIPGPAEGPDADITVEWCGPRDVRFDGPGGALAKADSKSLTFDAREDWLLQGSPQTPGAFYLLPVALHEIGHCLGLAHSARPNEVMSPYYVANRVALSRGDVAAARAATSS